ncbi:MAG: DUF4129 domain-containing protein [Bradymonadia bacterium]
MPRLPLIYLLFALSCLSGTFITTSAFAGGQDEVRAEIDNIYRGDRLQKELDVDLSDGWGDLKPPQTTTSQRERRVPTRERDDLELEVGSGLGKGLMWILIGVCGVVLVIGTAQRLGNYTPDVASTSAVDAQQAPVKADVLRRRVGGEAESLAQAGDYAEAIHALLLKTLEALSRHRQLRPAMTSREIVSQIELHPEARDALSHLVDAVEISLFGGRQPGESAWRACQASFEQFLGAYQRRVA